MSSSDHVLDPVCGMLIEPHHAAGTRVHREATFHLCSLGCLAKFDADADAYIAASRHEEFRVWRATVLTPMNSAPEQRPAAPAPDRCVGPGPPELTAVGVADVAIPVPHGQHPGAGARSLRHLRLRA